MFVRWFTGFVREVEVGSGLYIYRWSDCSGLYGVVCCGGTIGGNVMLSVSLASNARLRNRKEVINEDIKARQWRDNGSEGEGGINRR